MTDASPAPRVLGLSPAHAAALAWAGGWFSGLVILWLDRDLGTSGPGDRFVRLHALQAVIAVGGLMALAVGSWGFGLMMAFVSPMLFRGLTWLSTVTWGLLAAVWLVGLVQAWRGRPAGLPFISGWADRLTSRHSTLPAPSHPL